MNPSQHVIAQLEFSPYYFEGSEVSVGIVGVHPVLAMDACGGESRSRVLCACCALAESLSCLR